MAWRDRILGVEKGVGKHLHSFVRNEEDGLYTVLRVKANTFSSVVYPTGLVCISILHAPGDDPNHYEQASERWSPIQSVEKILISVMSMLAEPNDESPANIEAAKMWRERRPEFEKRVREGVRRDLGLA